MNFNMKKNITSIFVAALLAMPVLAQANVEELVLEDEYLNVGETVQETVLNASEVAKPSNVNNWGSDWGNKIPFKGNVPHGVAAYGANDVSVNFPKF